MITFKATGKGFLLGNFKDRYGARCSIQESSYQEDLCLWVGVETDVMGETLLNARMHLTQEQARELAEALLYFANEGSLGQYDANSHFRVGSWVRGIGKDNFGIYGRITMAHMGEHLTVQDQNTPGEEGQITCIWETAPKIWSPAEAPPEGRTIYEHLDDDDDDVGV